jgi:hypothetical protein
MPRNLQILCHEHNQEKMTKFDDWRPLWARVLMPVRDTRADIHDGPEQRSNERPDTLMQDHHLPDRQENPLQRTSGPYIGSKTVSASNRHEAVLASIYYRQRRCRICSVGARPTQPPHLFKHHNISGLMRGTRGGTRVMEGSPRSGRGRGLFRIPSCGTSR